jgi:hypothetical protein
LAVRIVLASYLVRGASTTTAMLLPAIAAAQASERCQVPYGNMTFMLAVARESGMTRPGLPGGSGPADRAG